MAACGTRSLLLLAVSLSVACAACRRTDDGAQTPPTDEQPPGQDAQPATTDEPAEATTTAAAESDAEADIAAVAAAPDAAEAFVESAARDPEYETVASLVVEYETETGPIRYTAADASIAVGSVGIFQYHGFATSVWRVRRPGQSPRDAVSLEELWSEIHEQLPDGEVLAFVDRNGTRAIVTRDGVWKATGTKGFDGAPSRSMIVQVAPVRREYLAVPWPPGPMAADADRFYWIATGHTTASKLFSVRRSGGTPRELWAGEVLEQLATDGEFVYLCARDPTGEHDSTSCDLGWSRGTCGMRVVRLSVGGGEPETLAGRQATCEGLALHGDTVIWASGGSIYRMSKGGGDAERLAREPLWIESLQVHDGFVYWQSHGPTPELRRRRL